MSVTTQYPVSSIAFTGLCSDDAAASQAFYPSVFGWEKEIMTMGDDEFTMFRIGGDQVATMYEMAPARKQAGVHPHWNVYIAVADVDETIKRATELGGKLLLGPMDAEGDVMANLEDPTGARFSVWQSKTRPVQTRLNEMGALCWGELYTRDPKAAAAFYTGLLGWKAEPFEGAPSPYTRFFAPSVNCPIGGMIEITDHMEDMKPQWLPYFMVSDVEETASRVREQGGQVLGPWDITGVGRIANMRDTQGANFAVIAPLKME